MALSVGRQWIATHGLRSGRAGSGGGSYVSPFLLEILSTRSGAPAFTVATGSLVANTGQTISCSRAASAYCLGNDGLLHLLGPNTVRVEPTGLLREGTSTNALQDSQNIGAGSWTSENTVTINGAVAPDGNTTASILTTVAGAGAHRTYSGLGSGSAAAKSIYVKQPGSNACRYLAIGDSDMVISYGIIDLQTGTYISGTGDTNGRVDALANGWYRLQYVGTDNSFWTIYPCETALPAPGGYTAVGGKSLYVWQAQQEVGLGFATSGILTTGAAATRDSDQLTVTNPLAALSQPVTDWQAGWQGFPLAGGTWTTVGAAGIDIFLANGTNGGVNSFRLGIGAGYHTNGGGDVNTNAFNSAGAGWADQTTANPLSVRLVSSGANVTAVPPLAGEPVAVGQINPFDATLTLGSPTAIANFAHQGHMHDIFMSTNP